MRRLFSTGLVTIACLASGCATGPAPLLKPPPAAASTLTLAPSPVIEQVDHVTGHLDPSRRVVYMQMEGGGGLAVGLLLGPLGTAANVGMINARTQSDIGRLQGKVTVRPEAVFRQAVGPAALEASAGSSTARATPYLLIQKVDGQLVASAGVYVEQDAGPVKWTARYLAQLPGRYGIEQMETFGPAENARLEADAAAAFLALHGRMQQETPERVSREPRLTFKSRLTSMMFMIEMQGALVAVDDERVWIRTYNAVIGLRKADVEYALVRS